MGTRDSAKGLATNYEEGGDKTGGGGGQVKFYPDKRGGAVNVLTMLKRGHNKC